MAEPRLEAPTVERFAGYVAMLRRAGELGETGDGFNLLEPGDDAGGYVEAMAAMERGGRLPAGYVPQSTRWLVEGDAVVGEARLRHRLTPALEVEGGHVGYFVHPDRRGRGLGHAILRLSLDELRRLGVGRVLVTCNADNAPSRRVIERAGGVFRATNTSPRSGKAVRAYWLDLRRPPRG